MRRVFLIRHAQPALPGGERCCLGLSDFPLSALGRLQAALLGETLRSPSLRVYTSPLTRAVETAAALSDEASVVEDLREMSAGDWDGLPFSQIRERWPALYEARGKDRSLPIPGGEPFADYQRRFVGAVTSLLAGSGEDLAIVAHSAVNQALLCHLLAVGPFRDARFEQPYASWFELRDEGAGLVPLFPAQIPKPELSEALCLSLLRAAGLPERVIAHSLCVAAEADRIACALEEAGLPLDRTLIRRAALLHDLARLEPAHPQTAAAWLTALGYPELAGPVRQHHELARETLDENAVVYIADKCVLEDRRVPLRRRFAQSLAKCSGPEALAAHERRAAQALRVAGAVNTQCKREVIL